MGQQSTSTANVRFLMMIFCFAVYDFPSILFSFVFLKFIIRLVFRPLMVFAAVVRDSGR